MEEIIFSLDLKGEKGETGNTGPPGPKGDPGTSPTIEQILAKLEVPLSGVVKRAVADEVAKLEQGLEQKIAVLVGDQKTEITNEMTTLIASLRKEINPGLTVGDVDDILDEKVNPHLKTLAESVASIQMTIVELEARLNRPVENPRRHFVLVMPADASYAPRIMASYERASEAFSPIRLLEPIGYHGDLPALVPYEDRIPVATWTGERAVEDMLNRISNGEAETLFP